MTSTAPLPTLSGATPALASLGVIRAEGPDAGSFLHGQLTQDFVLLRDDEARLAALCTAKGRMIASFIGLRTAPECILLVCSRDLLPATLKRLSMFVLRAKVKLSDATADYAVYGLAGAALAANGLDPAASPGHRTAVSDASAVALYPADGVPRALWIAPADAPPPQGGPLPVELWAWSEVRSGVVTLSTPVIDAFVPQMLNYESIDGVNFKKGCYPGQEIVARSQFRGTLKRRGYLVEAESGPLAAGQEIFAADPELPVGTIAQAAQGPDGRWAAMASMQVAAAGGGSLHAGDANGPALRIEPLPYPLRDDI